MIRSLFAAILARLRRRTRRQVGTRPTRAQRIVRVEMATDVRYATKNAQPVRIDTALWEAEMDGHLLTLSDGIPLWTWALGADA